MKKKIYFIYEKLFDSSFRFFTINYNNAFKTFSRLTLIPFELKLKNYDGNFLWLCGKKFAVI